MLCLWGGVTAGGMWYFVYRYALPAAPPSRVERLNSREVLTDTRGKAIPLSGSASITLLDFTSSECGCSQFVKSDVERLAQKYTERGVHVVHILEDESSGGATGEFVSDAHGVIAKRFGVGATPGAVVIRGDGEVVYAGAYNRARFCDDVDSAYADQAIDAALRGKKPSVRRTPFFGCAVPRA